MSSVSYWYCQSDSDSLSYAESAIQITSQTLLIHYISAYYQSKGRRKVTLDICLFSHFAVNDCKLREL